MSILALLPVAFALFTPWPTITAAQTVPQRGGDQATVWYLRNAGWAVRLDGVLLIFDYQERVGLEDVTSATPRTLENGFIDPEEIGDLDVFVFVSHAHGDHYDPVIFDWQGQIESLTYFIGWDEQPESHCERFTEPDADCHILAGPRATVEVNSLNVYTINASHDDIPDVAYLVRIGNWVVYHNGDYMGDHVADYAYLKAISDRIDLAFVSGLPGRRWPHVSRAGHLAREFDVPVLFAMHFRDLDMCEDFVAEMRAEGTTAEIECPSSRGQRFIVTKDAGL